jgi:hypothetical protein
VSEDMRMERADHGTNAHGVPARSDVTR